MKSKHIIFNRIIFLSLLLLLNFLLLIAFSEFLNDVQLIFGFTSIFLEPIFNKVSIIFYSIIRYKLVLTLIYFTLLGISIYKFHKQRCLHIFLFNLLISILFSIFTFVIFIRGEACINHDIDGNNIENYINNYYNTYKILPSDLDNSSINTIYNLSNYVYKPQYQNSLNIFEYNIFLHNQNFKTVYSYDFRKKKFEF